MNRYLIITPCRDEAEFARRTLESVTRQTVPPALWVIVDDGSTDETPQILAEYARRFDYIRVIRREDRGRRSVGPGVIDAFYAGYEAIDPQRFDYICKLDLDLELPPGYFERLFQKFDADPRLGTASGKSWISVRGRSVPERSGDQFSQGQTKLYRMQCFREIGGFVREVMWDGIDCHRCRMLGWKAASFRDPELRFLHLRVMGSSFRSIYRGRMRWGFGQYYMGTHPLYALAIAVYRMAERPWVVGGLLIGLGYYSAWFRGRPRYDDCDPPEPVVLRDGRQW